MEYWIALLLLHSAIALPTSEPETKHQDAAVDQQRTSPRDTSGVDVVAHEIATRHQDPTENLVCRLFKMNVPSGMVMVPPNQLKYLIKPVVGLREYLYSPAMYAALCVSPEKPRPYPLFFSPPAPLAAPAPTPVVNVLPVSKVPAVVAPVSAATAALTPSALGAPPPAISLVFSSPVTAIGATPIVSPAVNIGVQAIAGQV